MTHGAYLNEAKRGARATRDKHRRRGEREALGILKAAGLQGDPLARLVARQVGRLEAMVHRLEHHHELRGYFSKGGELKPSVGREADTIGKLLDEARRLFDQLREFSPEQRDKEHEFRVTYAGVEEVSEAVGPPWTDPATLAAAFAAQESARSARTVKVDGSESAGGKGKKESGKIPSAEEISPPDPEPATRPETAAEKYGWTRLAGGDEN